MIKKLILILGAAVFITSAAFAKKDVTEQDLGPENSWQNEFDVEGSAYEILELYYH